MPVDSDPEGPVRTTTRSLDGLLPGKLHGLAESVSDLVPAIIGVAVHIAWLVVVQEVPLIAFLDVHTTGVGVGICPFEALQHVVANDEVLPSVAFSGGGEVNKSVSWIGGCESYGLRWTSLDTLSIVVVASDDAFASALFPCAIEWITKDSVLTPLVAI